MNLSFDLTDRSVKGFIDWQRDLGEGLEFIRGL